MELSHNQVQVSLGLRELRSHRERTHVETWGRRGFLPAERYYLSEISRNGAGSPAVRAMVQHRVLHLLNNKVQYRWSNREYARRVALDYERFGVRGRRKWESLQHYFLDTFYDYLNIFKNKVPGGRDYVYPERQRWVPKGKKKGQTTQRKQLKAKIDEWNNKINAAAARGDQVTRRALTHERNVYQRKLDRLGEK